MKGSTQEMDEETRQYFVSFSEHLKLKEVIAGARFPMSKRSIEDALEGYQKTSKSSKLVRQGPDSRSSRMSAGSMDEGRSLMRRSATDLVPCRSRWVVGREA